MFTFIIIKVQINMIECQISTSNNASFCLRKHYIWESGMLSCGLVTKKDFNTIGAPSALSLVYLRAVLP